MIGLPTGRYTARLAVTQEDLCQAQKLRYLAFHSGHDEVGHGEAGRGKSREGQHPCPVNHDADDFDALCQHVLIEDAQSGTLVCCFRLLSLAGGAEIGRSYSAQFYELSALIAFPGPMIELGRFCLHPDWHDPDILRLAWGVMTRLVDAGKVEMLFGCSSFRGTETAIYHEAFAMLRERHLAPKRWLPRVKAPDVFRFAQKLHRRKPDAVAAMRMMPPLLRTYLLMGGWVSDHAVVDQDMNTLHVFTGLEIRAIPQARARLLRQMAG
ncbi:MAG: GNAT family N-acyltransferase [Paracoccaceae bacterium]|nr:GNAT family N-acyltransferase [Paracoccaceae bacterium]